MKFNFFKRHKVLLSCVGVLILYLFWPVGHIANPVPSTAPNNYHPQSFGQPWGDHRHRGIDVFAPTGAEIKASAGGLVIRTIKDDGKYQGGNTVEILGLGGRIYHYAHMSEILVHPFEIVSQGETIGKVGRTGNASRPGCPPHCHFSIVSFLPHPENYKVSWFMLDPAEEIRN